MKKSELLNKLNEIKGISNPQQQAHKIFDFAFASNIGSIEEMVTDMIVRKGTILDSINNEVNQGNLAGIHILTKDINDWEADYFGVDGYGNYYTLTLDKLSSLIYDMEVELSEE